MNIFMNFYVMKHEAVLGGLNNFVLWCTSQSNISSIIYIYILFLLTLFYYSNVNQTLITSVNYDLHIMEEQNNKTCFSIHSSLSYNLALTPVSLWRPSQRGWLLQMNLYFLSNLSFLTF